MQDDFSGSNELQKAYMPYTDQDARDGPYWLETHADRDVLELDEDGLVMDEETGGAAYSSKEIGGPGKYATRAYQQRAHGGTAEDDDDERKRTRARGPRAARSSRAKRPAAGSAAAASSGPPAVSTQAITPKNIVIVLVVAIANSFGDQLTLAVSEVWESDILLLATLVLFAVLWVSLAGTIVRVLSKHPNVLWADGVARFVNFFTSAVILVPPAYVIRLLIRAGAAGVNVPQQALLWTLAVLALAFTTTFFMRKSPDDDVLDELRANPERGAAAFNRLVKDPRETASLVGLVQARAYALRVLRGKRR